MGPLQHHTSVVKNLKMFCYLFTVSVLCGAVISVQARGIQNTKRHWWGSNGECMTQAEFGSFPQNGRKPVEIVVTFDSELIGVEAHGDMFEINGETGSNGRFDIAGTEFTITKKESKLINEFSNLSLKPIVAIDGGKHCW